MLRHRIIPLLMEDMLKGDRLVKEDIDIPSSNLQWLEGYLG